MNTGKTIFGQIIEFLPIKKNVVNAWSDTKVIIASVLLHATISYCVWLLLN
jgi:hypothetical protein